jgi:GT2 family glycosyltransferase
MDVSICIVNWNVKRLLHRCLESIREKTSGVSYEIIVLDNNSQDSSVEMIRAEYPDCRLIASNENLGFIKGNNVAAKQARGRYILLLNPDTELMTNAVYGMYSFLEKNKGHGAVGCKLIYPGGDIQYTCASTFPTPLNELNQLLYLNRIFPRIPLFSGRELEYWDHRDSRDVDCLSGACIMLPRRLFDEIGGFDEAGFMYAEDLDLCCQILKKGRKIYYLSTETIIHAESASSSQVRKKNFAALLQRKQNEYFLKKNFGCLKAFNYRLAILIGSCCRIVAMTVLYLVSRAGCNHNHEQYARLISQYHDLFIWSLGLKEIHLA